MSSKYEKEEKLATKEFSRSVLTNYAQILGTAHAHGISPHRAKLAKLQEISNIRPCYKPPN